LRFTMAGVSGPVAAPSSARAPVAGTLAMMHHCDE
jgi:hypothetical protein